MSSASDRFAVLLRGVNVGRNNRLAMADLRTILTDAGCIDVKTLLQSGNAVCTSGRDPDDLAAFVGSALNELMQKDIGVIVRDVSYVAGVVTGNPFAARSPDGKNVGVTFLAEHPDARVVQGAGPQDAIVLRDRVIYTCAPALDGAEFPNWTKLLRQTVTARNWRTTTRILRALDG
jgi:uncharacterized protein (DUF1697 family)